MSEQFTATYTASATPVKIVTALVLSEDERRLILRYRQAKAQRLRLLIDCGSMQLQVLGRLEKLGS